MTRRDLRWLRVAVAGALAWERGVVDGGGQPAFPFRLARTEVERARLHKILVRRWNHLAREHPTLLDGAVNGLRRQYQLTGARQSDLSDRILVYLLDSFRNEAEHRAAG